MSELTQALFGRDDADTTLRASADAWETPIADRVTALQDVGRDVYIWGFTPDESRALIVDRDNDTVSIAHVATVNSLGRWECSSTHLSYYTDVYGPRFPKR